MERTQRTWSQCSTNIQGSDFLALRAAALKMVCDFLGDGVLISTNWRSYTQQDDQRQFAGS